MCKQVQADVEVASGRIPADVVFRNGRYLDVFTGSIVSGDLAVREGRIMAIGPPHTYRGQNEVNLDQRIVVPGLIDAHVHIESSLLGPSGFASLTVPRGTTTIIADPHEIANVCGAAGISWMLDASENVPQSVFIMLPSCVPATSFDDAGAVLEADDLAPFFNHPRVLGLGEVMDYPAVAAGREAVMRKIELAREKNGSIDGHSPGMGGRDLAAYAVAGIQTDHECSSLEEMKDRLRLGMRVLIREGTACKDLATLIKGVDALSARRCCFCTDDKLPGDIIRSGHIDCNVRLAMAHGLDAATAICLATLNAAEAYGLDDRGAIAPGRRADFAVLKGPLEEFAIGSVYRDGQLVADGGKLLREPEKNPGTAVRDTVTIKGPYDWKIPVPSGNARVIHVKPGTILTGEETHEVSSDAAGNFLPDGERDLLKLALVERHQGTGRIGMGILRGYGLRGGAIASSIAHDSHNIIIVGDDDAAMRQALTAVAGAGGGIALAASGGEILACIPLPLGGLMTDDSTENLAASLDQITETAYQTLGVNTSIDPFMHLGFLALSVIPDLKLTTRGLFDVNRFDFVPVSV